MTREDQILIQILAAFTNGRSIGSLRVVSLEALYQAAQKHNVGGIVSSMLQPVLKTRNDLSLGAARGRSENVRRPYGAGRDSLRLL